MAKSNRVVRTSRSAIWAAVVLSALIVPTLQASPAGAATGPAKGLFFGAYVRSTGGLSFFDAERAFESKIGRRLAIVNKFHVWSDTHYSDEAKFVNSGQRVMVSWHPTDGAGDPGMAQKVSSGRYDSLIRSAANGLKALNGPVLLRWDFEMTQSPGQKEYIGTPSAFIAAWRHMHAIFAAQGATNVQWVWAPQSAGFSGGNAAAFYPGDAYVDWIQASDVMGGHFFPSFSKVFSPFYQWAAPHHKPLLVWMGVPENPSDANWKANWFIGMRSTIKNSMPAIKGVIYYQAADSAGNFVAGTSTQSWNAFKAMALDTYFKSMP